MSSPGHGSRDLTMEALISPRVRVEDVVVAQRQTRTFESSLARSIQAESEQKVEEVAMKAEVVQQLTIEQLNLFQQRQESLAAKTAEYLQQQYDNQVELNAKQAALSAQLEEQQNALAQQYQLMREAAETVGQQGRQIEDLKGEVLSPRGQSRWGWFARGAGHSTRVADDDELMAEEGASVGRNEPAMTVATGANMPVPPVYRGSTKKEKKAFMDSYLIYKRRITALNQGSYGRVFVMPLSACIEHRTLVRICMYELGKPETEITEEEWKAYFLAARRPEVQDHARLTQAMRALSMDTSLPDAESRVMQLVTDFNAILDTQDMDDFPIDEPKMSVEFLCAALKPPALKQAIVTELKRTVHKSTKKSVKVFVDWLRSRVSAFLIFESAIQQTTGGGGSQAQSQPKPGNTARSTGRFQQKGGTTAGGDSKSKGGGSSGVSSAQKASAAKKPEPQDRPQRKCFKCGDLTHGVFQCPLANATEAKELYDKNRKQSKPVGAIAISEAQPVSPPAEPTAAKTPGPLPCVVNQVLDAWAKPDSGAEVSVVTPRILQELKAQGQWLQCRDLKQWESIKGITATPMVIKQEVKLDLRFDTVNGGLTLKNLTCWVVSGGLPRGMGDILLCEGVMERLGYNAQALLDQARNVREVYDMDEAVPTSGVRNVLSYAVAASSHIEATPEEQELQPEEEQRCFPDVNVDQDREEARAQEWSILEDKLNEASELGCSVSFREELATILYQYRDVFRIKLGRDPPVDMPPLKVTLKPNAIPVRCKARRYHAEHRAFMKKHVQELIDAGLCYRNPHSKWCSPPLIVKKVDPGDFRMTVDVRRVNAQTLRLLWPMPILEVIMDYLTDSELYFLLDFFKGYWQFLLSLECQELFSFLTDMGIFTPTRVLMGGSDSVAYCQATVQEMFAEFLYNGLLIWLDDLLGYAKTENGLLKLLRGVLKVCALKGLKLNPSKCSFYLREAKWCGRVISKTGVRHDPERISALQSLSPPLTGQDLQQFICALGWMRMSIPGHNKLTQPLVDLMETVYKAAGGRTKRQVSHVQLLEAGWSDIHTDCINACKQALGNAVELAHVKPEYKLSVFTDASASHWGAVITQVPPEHGARLFSEQHHEPLMFLSGTFSGAARSWAIVEKEAFAIIATCQRADYLLHRPGGFTLYTDHRNLRFIFNPSSVLSSVPKYTADKLQRWALILMAYDYEICDIAGNENVWADLLSRWGSTLPHICAIRLVPYEYSPTLQEDFKWPTFSDVINSQGGAVVPVDMELTADTHGVLRLTTGQIWIPAEDGLLQLRICIVGHFGVAGHRGLDTTVTAIAKRFWWADLFADVKFFVGRCLHCVSVVGGPPVPRPLGEAMHAERPNELIHWDYLFMGDSSGEDKYILVIKDDASKYVWFFAVPEATAATTYLCLMDWFAAFGVCLSWVSDQGTHFKNEVIQSLQHALGAHHHFTTARCPWANGTVEVVMREALRCFRSLLSEWRLSTRDWPRLTKLVQLVLNHTPAKSLAGHAPVTVMTGLPAMSPLDAISLPTPLETTTLSELMATREELFTTLQSALDNMHKTVAKASQAARSKGRRNARSAGVKMAQYAIGDYVLYADVWAHTRAKLRVKWCGPAQVVNTVSSWIFTVKNLLSGDERDVHASRLKFYSDDTLDVTEELLRHIAHNSEGHVVSGLLDTRYSEAEKRFEILVTWRGLSQAEDSWEPATTLLEDVPVMVKNFIRAHRQTAKFKRLATSLNLQVLLKD